jgi:hypothetical protein
MPENEGMSEYADWLVGLTAEDFENERFTVEHEAQLIGMSDDEAIEKSNALNVEAYRRAAVQLRVEAPWFDKSWLSA